MLITHCRLDKYAIIVNFTKLVFAVNDEKCFHFCMGVYLPLVDTCGTWGFKNHNLVVRLYIIHNYCDSLWFIITEEIHRHVFLIILI